MAKITVFDIREAAQKASGLDKMTRTSPTGVLGYIVCPKCGKKSLAICDNRNCVCNCGKRLDVVEAFATIGITLTAKQNLQNVGKANNTSRQMFIKGMLRKPPGRAKHFRPK